MLFLSFCLLLGGRNDILGYSHFTSNCFEFSGKHVQGYTVFAGRVRIDGWTEELVYLMESLSSSLTLQKSDRDFVKHLDRWKNE